MRAPAWQPCRRKIKIEAWNFGDGYDQGICRATYVRSQCMLRSVLQRYTLPITSIQFLFFIRILWIFSETMILWCPSMTIIYVTYGPVERSTLAVTATNGGDVKIGQFLWRTRKNNAPLLGTGRRTTGKSVGEGIQCQSQWPRSKVWSADCRLLWLRLRIPPGDWCVSFECCVFFKERSLRRVDHSSRGELPTVVCLSVMIDPR